MTLHTRIGSDPIDVAALMRFVRSDRCGAVATFVGTVRDHNDGLAVRALEYEAYEPMAARELRRIAESLAQRHALEAVAIEHRTGRLAVGDVAVAIVVAAAHRRPALAACSEAIELVKRDVSIWKREHHEGGSRWVAGCDDTAQEVAHAAVHAQPR